MNMPFQRNLSLFIELTKREFLGKYQGSFGGVFWAFAQPLFLLSVYTVSFGIILKSRWGFAGNTIDYSFILFAGLIIFNAFSEVLMKSSTLVTQNPNFVKKIVFPLQLLPFVAVATALLHALIGVIVWLIGYTFIIGQPKISILFVPLIFICFSPVLVGISLALSSLGVIARDASQFAGMLNHALLFLTPIFYSIEAAPPLLQKILLLNPLTYIVEQFRLVLFYGQFPALKGLFVYFVLSFLFSISTYILFQRLRPSFADVL